MRDFAWKRVQGWCHVAKASGPAEFTRVRLFEQAPLDWPLQGACESYGTLGFLPSSLPKLYLIMLEHAIVICEIEDYMH